MDNKAGSPAAVDSVADLAGRVVEKVCKEAAADKEGLEEFLGRAKAAAVLTSGEKVDRMASMEEDLVDYHKAGKVAKAV